MKHDEDNIVRPAVIDYLRKRGHTVLPHETKASLVKRGGKVFYLPDPNGYFRTPGESDLLVFSKSSLISPIWMELKEPGERKIDPKQKVFREIVKDMGHEYVVVNCVQDCVDLGL